MGCTGLSDHGFAFKIYFIYLTINIGQAILIVSGGVEGVGGTPDVELFSPGNKKWEIITRSNFRRSKKQSGD
jgi:hypothetical protein